ncbi:putative nuclease HARBI1 [Episyrphus balteatus]|uniref:putative nuclease HARBI1 n=1 Tax=Episyrphus balteatus TaxID=286459 RepID=UPI002485BDA6|nr:putative nuclease HARBI1 [Episyrphus balteatus]
MDFINEINEIVMSSSSEDDVEIFEEEETRNQRSPRRQYRMSSRACVADYEDIDFRKYFRLKKVAFRRLHSMVVQDLDGDRRRSRELTAEHKLLAVLRLLACGNMEQTAADYAGISQPTVANILPAVCDAILRQLDEFIWMPRTNEERLQKATSFARLGNFPRCIGAIDCTHVRIISPGGDISEAFRNRHGYFSINVQTISDANLKVQNVVARWPGSAHDQTIFRQSNVCLQLENGVHGDFVIVADSGYANTFFLCTPFTRHRNLDELTPAERIYQKSILTTRNVVERQYGVLKRRFPILASGIQLYRLDLVQKVIVVCCILHNLCIDYGDVDSGNLPLPPGMSEEALSEPFSSEGLTYLLND